MIKLIKKIALFFFDIIDLHYHQARIKKYLIKKNIIINNFVDVGSHMGTYTDLIKSFNKDAICYLFEPQSKIFNKLVNKYMNKKDIFLFNFGISNLEGEKKLYVNIHDLTSTFSEYNEYSKYLNFKAKLFETNVSQMSYKAEKVKTVTLKNFISKNKIYLIDLLKIDTEGHELKVLKGLGDNIKFVNNILIEFHHRNVYKNYNPRIIHEYLINKNFKLVKTFKFPFSFQDRIYSKIID
jgi:FkbM family methyltransferase